MTVSQLMLRNLGFHRRAHFAVLLGAAVGCAVLTGALLVGDSLRGSLRDRAEGERSGVDFALVGGKFFSAKLLADYPNVEAGILVRGSIYAGDDDDERVLSGVTVLAGLKLGGDPPPQTGASLPQALAESLHVKLGDKIRLKLVAANTAPRESLLGQRDLDKSQIEVEGTVAAILPNDAPLAKFRLAPGALPPRNVIVPIEWLQKKLSGREGTANALLARGGERDSLQDELKKRLTLEDWGVTITQRKDYLALESRQTMLEPAVINAAKRAFAGHPTAPTLVYLANQIAVAGKESIPYSVIAALEPSAKPPLGPFLPPGVESLKDDEIVLADWPESPLRGIAPGTAVTLTYFRPELIDGKQTETTATFKFRGFVSLSGAAADPYLTPAFPGITDKLGIRDWDPPFDYDNTKIKKRDEDYWQKYKTTPKAYVTLAAGQKIWGSRFGNLTSIRLTLDQKIDDVKENLRKELKPQDGGLAFDDIKARFADASQGGQDFGFLFLGFSFFLIASALLLIGLLTRLGLERRATEIGLLIATGWRTRTVRRVLLGEGVLVAAVGGLLGLAGAIAYAAAMLRIFRTLWPDPSASSFLHLHVSAMTLLIGFVATLTINVLTIIWALRMLNRVAPTRLIAGELNSSAGLRFSPPSRWLRWAIFGGLVGSFAFVAIGFVQTNPEFQAMSFFGGGSLLLASAIGIIWRRLKRPEANPANSLWSLGAGNARRNPGRSVLTAALLASASFLLIAVESFRREPEKDFSQRTGGSGGFAYIIETEIPVYRDPNEGDGRADLLSAIDVRLQRESDAAGRKKQARDILAKTHIYPFRLQAGDDASCLNLYKANRPRLLGVPESFAKEETRFQFVAMKTERPEEKANPWRMLFRKWQDEDRVNERGEKTKIKIVPIFGEENTLMWMIKKELGETLPLLDENGQPVKTTEPDKDGKPIEKAVEMKIVGVLKDSVFPSELLMSATDFQQFYPRREGYPFLLVETPPDQSADAAELLRIGLAKHGPEITRTRDRLAAYLAVENTYLTTFQLLGGLGLLLGALGLAVVLLRGVWERRSELALLRALGYRHRALGFLVFAENGLLVLYGLEAGALAALASVLPHLSTGGSLPWLRLMVLLGMVILSGLLAGLWAVRETLRAPLVPALRKD